MAFVKDTKIFTNSGWKNIQDIAGQDKVLVRNFVGDAEFIQPFALKRRKYDDEIIKIGAKNWNFSVTPEHIVVYDRDEEPVGKNFVYERADEVKVSAYNRIYRKFKFLPPEEYRRETIKIYDEDFGTRWVNVSNNDWYVLCAYVLQRGYLSKASSTRLALNFYLNNEKIEAEIAELGDILDRIGVQWSIIPSRTIGQHTIRVSAKNTLASRVKTRLGAQKRREMYLPDTMIYNCTKELADKFIDTLIELSKRPTTERGNSYQFTTNNDKLVDSLSLLCTLWGYGAYSTILAKKGQDTGRGALRKDVIKLTISNLAKTYSPTKIESYHYNDYVYSIDLFDGQVYVKQGTVPVWVNPK